MSTTTTTRPEKAGNLLALLALPAQNHHQKAINDSSASNDSKISGISKGAGVNRTNFILTLTDAGKPHDAPTFIRLRRLLKLALRGFAFRCVDIRQAPDDKPLVSLSTQSPPPTGCQCDRRDNEQLEPLPSHNPPIANAGCVGANYTHEVAADASTEGCDNERGKLAMAGGRGGKILRIPECRPIVKA
ncbi:MAG: hypothetical protein SGI86_21695 [Deltaproteobacteria bacterium]|nr:hypothetical protein [Deltaproteobacteria bacterium]